MINNESYKVVYTIIKIYLYDIIWYNRIMYMVKHNFFYIHLNFRCGRNQIFK